MILVFEPMKQGLLKQKEYEDKFSTKILGGVTDAFQGTVKEVSKAVARLVDMGLIHNLWLTLKRTGLKPVNQNLELEI